MKKKLNIIFRILFLFFLQTSLIYARQVESSLKSNQVYISPISQQINQTIINSNKVIKNSLQGETITIPNSWRLINVIPNKKGDYVLFFQDINGDINSFGMKSDGSISGEDVIFIPSERKK